MKHITEIVDPSEGKNMQMLLTTKTKTNLVIMFEIKTNTSLTLHRYLNKHRNSLTCMEIYQNPLLLQTTQ